MPKPLFKSFLKISIISIIHLISFYSFSSENLIVPNRPSETCSYFSLLEKLPLMQVSQEEIHKTLPIGLNPDVYNSIPALIIKAYDPSVGLKRNKESPVGYNVTVNLSSVNNGRWTQYANNINTYHLKIKSPGASEIALVLTHVSLLPGEKLFIFNPNGRIYAFDQGTIPASGIIALNYLKGNELVIEHNVKSGSKNTGSFIIETVSNTFADNSKRTLDECNIDINCLSGDTWKNTKRSVVKMLIYDDSVTRFCSCVLVNNTANDRKPYILTGQHCVPDQAIADRSVFIFDYETTECDGAYGLEEMQLSGAKFLATSYEHDFTLLELYTVPPLSFRPYYSGWDISDTYLNNVACIHHPWGTPKKISRSYGSITTGDFNDGTSRATQGFWNIRKWDKGTTENGSSGAPLFNINRLLIGTLTGGSAECGSPYNDYFTRISQSWEATSDAKGQLKHWLDPLNYGTLTLEGMDPFAGITTICDTFTNIKAEENIKLLSHPGGTGYYSGVNSDHINSFAERFTNSDSIIISGIIINPGSINTAAAGGLVVSINKDDHGIPGNSLAEAYVAYNALSLNEPGFIEFYPPVIVSKDYFISYSPSYSAGDRFALKQADWRNNKNNSAYLKLPDGWAPITQLSGYGSSFDIKVVQCSDYQAPTPISKYLKVYPNPTFDPTIIIDLPFDALEISRLSIYDLQGKNYSFEYKTIDNKVELNVSGLSRGMYIIHIATSGRNYVCKFIKGE